MNRSEYLKGELHTAQEQAIHLVSARRQRHEALLSFINKTQNRPITPAEADEARRIIDALADLSAQELAAQAQEQQFKRALSGIASPPTD